MQSKQPAIYILASRRNGTLYTGVTSDLIRRIWQHRNDLVDGFTRTHGVHMLVYYEQHATMLDAIAREKQIKAGSRQRKVQLIEGMNPAWADLYESLL
jgi:putative endonuclease